MVGTGTDKGAVLLSIETIDDTHEHTQVKNISHMTKGWAKGGILCVRAAVSRHHSAPAGRRQPYSNSIDIERWQLFEKIIKNTYWVRRVFKTCRRKRQGPSAKVCVFDISAQAL